MDMQKPLIELFDAQGFIRNLSVKDRGEKDPMYRYQIRYIDDNDQLQEPTEWYSGFGMPPGLNGDYIIFKFKKKDQYNNFAELIDIKKCHDEVTTDDHEALEIVKEDINNPQPSTEMTGDNTALANIPEPKVIPKEGLSDQYKALLLNGTIHLCTRRGQLEHEEVVAQYNRFLEVLK